MGMDQGGLRVYVQLKLYNRKGELVCNIKSVYRISEEHIELYKKQWMADSYELIKHEGVHA